ncbi:hypothetical protein ACFLZX_03650 [Nanoarchaeota archaeon]
MHFKRHYDRTFYHSLSAPIVYLQIIPLIILDVFIEIYHRTCFRLYRIPLIRRSKYIRVDRHRLKYLSPFEKINCAYCGYANGLLQYSAKIAGETEKYWCGIKHDKNEDFVEPSHHKDFLEYDDEKNFDKEFN